MSKLIIIVLILSVLMLVNETVEVLAIDTQKNIELVILNQ